MTLAKIAKAAKEEKKMRDIEAEIKDALAFAPASLSVASGQQPCAAKFELLSRTTAGMQEVEKLRGRCRARRDR